MICHIIEKAIRAFYILLLCLNRKKMLGGSNNPSPPVPQWVYEFVACDQLSLYVIMKGILRLNSSHSCKPNLHVKRRGTCLFSQTAAGN